MRTSAFLAFVLTTLAAPAAAQEQPLSVIDWLSPSVEPQQTPVEPPLQGAAPHPVTVVELGAPRKGAVGLLPPFVSGLPRAIWGDSDEARLVQLIQIARAEILPAMQDLLRTMMLAEADPPTNATGDALLLARIDKLLELGALEQAKALLEQATPDTPELFRRWFDVALLVGTEHRACEVMRRTPAIAPTYPARIFCLARSGDWSAAALTLNTHRLLGDISAEQDALISRFLDPDLFEDEPPLLPPQTATPLDFRMHEAIGEPLSTRSLPLAFAHADLRNSAPWKARLEAVERLARYGAVSENVLQQQYTARAPAASGGLWDRAAAFQSFDASVVAANPQDIADNLPAAWRAMEEIRAEVLFARLYAKALREFDLPQQANDIATKIGLLSEDYAEVAETAEVISPILRSVALGDFAVGSTPLETAVLAGLSGNRPISDAHEDLLREGRLGEALLEAAILMRAAAQGDTRATASGLGLIVAAGYDDLARRAALQLLILDRAP